MRNIHIILVGKPESERYLGMPRRRWEGLLEWVLKKYVGSIRIGFMAQDRDQWWAVVGAVMNLWVPLKGGIS
jgi:hypothetical protein